VRYRTINSEGWYRVKLTHYNGCFNIDSTYVMKKPLPVVNYEVIEASCGNDNGQITLRTEDDPDNYLYHWLDDTAFRDPVRSGLKADIYQVEVISKETGCSLPMNIPVGEIGAPDVQIEASGDSIQCPGTEIMLVAKGANVYEWQLFPGEDLDTLIVTPWKDTEYVVKGTTVGADGKECSAFATHTVRIFPYTLPDLGTDRSVCEGETVELDGGSHFIKWNWSTGDTTEIVEFSELNDSILTLQVTDTNRCVLHDTIRVVFKPVPEIELGRDRAVCKGSPFTLDAGEADSYLWNTGDTTRQITVNQTSIYEVTITTDGCTNSDRVGIRVNDPNLLKIDSIVSNDISCYGKSDGEIKIFASGEGSVYTFSLDDGVSFSENQGYFQHLDAGSYPVVVSEDSACTVRYPHPVEIREPAEIVINYKQISPSCDQCSDGELILNISGGNPPYDILWSDLETGRKRSNLTLGDYPVWITDAHKCTGYRLVTLEMGHVALSIPNAFTPNGDGINETWIIASLNGFPDALVQVFDRFGRKVYESEKGYPVPWDGRDTDGNLLPMGSYFYIIRYNITQPPVSGAVTIIH
ncbi:MAG: gliding motility-associated C-terminal domain-containing protein, partial [Bacteroidales bacterium]|nr:gliding motility-associated C-terminal domain-containing protein [Bacteroidales bacterium]